MESRGRMRATRSSRSEDRLDGSALAYMRRHAIQERINGLRLNSVGWTPVPPLEPQMLGALDFVGAVGEPQIDRQLLQRLLIGLFAARYPIAMFELEFGIGPNLTGSQSGLFMQFAQRGLLGRFAWIEMPFGQIPTVGVSHQQELECSTSSKEQVAARKDRRFWHRREIFLGQ